ncbi:hypothetical protein [Clostridium cagae]|uniref:hypothetical protein n=1 Tax=Clostridium cagae TaxID=2080751 RepID=UPI0018F8B3CB|nr:hypothetical protein [Clostridium cagae]
MRNVSPPWAIINNSLRRRCWMIIGMLIISVSMIVLILILRALKHNIIQKIVNLILKLT